MFDFLRKLGRSEEEKQQETLSAYLDNELAPADRDRFEQQLALNGDLREKLAEMQLWQQQMRNLPRRRIPRNFTLDPALYERPQRQTMAGAYPVLRTATAITAFLLVIALAVNLYLGDFTGESTSQPVSVAMQEMAPAADEAAMAGAALSENETPAEAAPETFILEESTDKEADEVPVDIVEIEEEAPMEHVEAEVLSEEAEVIEGDELLSESTDLALSLDLDVIEGTALPQMARESSALPEAAPPVAEIDGQQVEETPQATAVADQAEAETVPAEESQEYMQPAFEDDVAATALSPVSKGLNPVVIGLGLLFIFLAILTLLTRARR